MTENTLDFTNTQVTNTVTESLSKLNPKHLEAFLFRSEVGPQNEVLDLIGTLARIFVLQTGIIAGLTAAYTTDGKPVVEDEIQGIWNTLVALTLAAITTRHDEPAPILVKSFSAQIVGITDAYRKASTVPAGPLRENAAEELLAALKSAGISEVTVTDR